MTYLSEAMEKWAPVLDDESGDGTRLTGEKRRVTAIVIENTIREQAKAAQATQGFINESLPSSSTANAANFDPVIVGLLRRAMPKLIAYDFCGVQPMTMPTGLIFAARNRYTNASGAEALFNEADHGFSTGAALNANQGTNPVDSTNGNAPWDSSAVAVTTGVATAAGEDFGGATTLNQMTFTIEKQTVTAVERGLQAGYTVELAQDLKAVHGLDAEAELSNLLSNQIIAEMNREVVRTMYKVAVAGAQTNTATAGTFDLDVDANGRWSVERFKGLLFQIEREANRVAQRTRMGRGNVIMCSSDVASALAMTGKLDVGNLSASEGLVVDDTGATFVGVLNNKYKVFIDPYMANGDANQFVVVGYKGKDLGQAGMFYCPYVPLTKHHAIDPATFQPKIAFKTRYALAGNPLNGYNYTNPSNAFGLAANSNEFFRMFRVQNIA
jgi:hypothetical protein